LRRAPRRRRRPPRSVPAGRRCRARVPARREWAAGPRLRSRADAGRARGTVSRGAAVEVRAQPDAGELPVALDGDDRDAEAFGDLLVLEVGEVAHLHHLRLPRVALAEGAEGAVEIEQVDFALPVYRDGDRRGIVTRLPLPGG